MSRYPSDPATRIVAVDDVGAVWIDLASPETRRHVVFGDTAGDRPVSEAERLQALSELAPQGSRTLWVLGHASMPCWLQTPPPGVRGLKELQAVARTRARQWLHPAHDTEALLVHADWHSTQPFFCEALPSHWQALLGPCPRISSPLRLGLTQLLGRRRPPAGWYAVTTPDEAHLLLRQRNQWQQLRSLRLRGGSETAEIADQLRGEWQRERLRQSGPDSPLDWLHLGHTSATWNAKDIRWLDAAWQQQINAWPAPPAAPAALSKANHQLWAFKHLGTGAVAP